MSMPYADAVGELIAGESGSNGAMVSVPNFDKGHILW